MVMDRISLFIVAYCISLVFRYSKKMGQHNKLMELRADNQRVEQENAAIRFRVDAITRQSIARENVTALRREQMKQITEEIPRINDEIQGECMKIIMKHQLINL